MNSNKMSIWILISLAALAGGFFVGKGCNNPITKTITKEDVNTFIQNETKELEKELGSDFFDRFSTPIASDIAKEHHMSYLNSNKVVYPENKDTAVRSFFVDKKDLDLLFKDAISGIRIYLSADVSNNLNLILIPQSKDSNNILNNGSIINTLSPCPMDCPKDPADKNLNSKNDLNFEENTPANNKNCKWRKKVKNDPIKWESADRTEQSK